MSTRNTDRAAFLTRILTPFWTCFFFLLGARAHHGSWRLGRVRMTVYPVDCAMHGALNIWTPWTGYVCWHPSTSPWGRDEWPWYLYVSPNATPWGATFAMGPGVAIDEKCGARMRRHRLGLVYDTELSYAEIKNAGMTFHYTEPA